MPWYLRKSIRLPAGFRLNLSKSGVGVSFGVKGARVSTGPRGTYVHLGRGGVYYRERIGGGTQDVWGDPGAGPTAVAGSEGPQPGLGGSTDEGSLRTMRLLNSRLAKPAYAPLVIGAGAGLSVVLGALSPWAVLVGVLATAWAGWLAAQRDVRRRTYSLVFHIDEAAWERWRRVAGAVGRLGGARRLWWVSASQHLTDWKRHAGATSALSRTPASVYRRPAPFIRSNVTPYCLDLGSQKLCFFPDRLYVFTRRAYTAVRYDELRVSCGSTRFVEDGAVPGDAPVEGYTWQFVNKDGSPDRRFAHNRQIPVVRYAEVYLGDPTGLGLRLHVSSTGAAQSFAGAFLGPAGERPGEAHDPRGHTPTQGRGPGVARQPGEPAVGPREVLGLGPRCTREEAEDAYRRLVRAYHPDTLAGVRTEIRALAEEKMKEVNAAYAQLKHEMGW